MVILRLIPFLWGFAEAVFFFIVPDVWLTWLTFTVRERKKLSLAIIWTVCGAILGGFFIYAVSRFVSSEQLVKWLDCVPGISRSLIQDVDYQVEQGGIGSVFGGVIRGIPYKLYASQWGADHGGLAIFVLYSILARGGRFILSVILARFIDILARKYSPNWESNKYIVFFLFWIGFYIFYFSHYSY